MKYLIAIIFLAFIFSDVNGQTDSITDTIHLKEVQISAIPAVSDQQAHFTEIMDTSQIALLRWRSLSDQLNSASSIYIRSYGEGGLSTATVQGMSASQTALVWNGIKVNSPVLGVTDLTLFPSFLLDNATVNYGGNGTLTGDASVAGTVILQSDAAADKKGWSGKLLQTAGSFGSLQSGLQVNYHSSDITTAFRYIHQQAENNYSYLDNDKIKRTQTNAAFNLNGASSDLKWKSKKLTLQWHTMLLMAEREIPPSIGTVNSSQSQRDNTWRTSIEANSVFHQWQYGFRGGFDHASINYRNLLSGINDNSSYTTFQGELFGARSVYNHLSTEVSLKMFHSNASSDGYSQQQQRNQQQAMASVIYKTVDIYASTGISAGLFYGKALPLQIASSFSRNINRQFYYRFNGSSIYRLPTLNELYFQPGGDERVQPEKGYAVSGGIHYKRALKNCSIHGGLNLFLTQLNRMLIWTPQSDGVYAIQNIQKVESKGANVETDVIFHLNKVKMRFKALIQLNDAKILQSSAVLMASEGKQMIYTPDIIWKGNLTISWKGWQLDCAQRHTGLTYTEADNSRWLDAYALYDVSLSKTTKLLNSLLSAEFTVRNLMNTNYRVIAFRAMPRRSVDVGLSVNF